jgi:hypothetical protein
MAALVSAPSGLRAEETLDLRVEAAVTGDNNVTRSRGSDKLSDTFYSLSAAKSHDFSLSPNWRLAVQGTAGAEHFNRYFGLSKVYASINGELEYRSSGEFDAPTYGLFADATVEQYNSTLRDGYRYTLGARVWQPLSTELNLFSAVTCNRRDGKSRVFDNDDCAVRANLDYAIGQKATLYGGAELRHGDIVSTAQPSLAYRDVAEATVNDDAFTSPARQAYKLRANTVIATVGYNVGVRTDQSLDLSLRWARSQSLAKPTFPGAEAITYYDVQAGIAYLLRF